ncbi:hypothetical protein MYX07_00680 [Patescibacteria group bacterium AH-259-L07]|nr:hypothetical protein [Patescibacteria group bacterium AH-259-L07]
MKTSVIAVLAAIGFSILLAGCDNASPPPAEPIRADINNDGTVEFVYLEMDKSRTGNDRWYDWDLKAVGAYGESQLSQPVVLLSFETKPENLRVEDYNSDGINDIVFLAVDKSITGNDRYYDWHLIVALGDGNGQFSKNQIVATFERRPGIP